MTASFTQSLNSVYFTDVLQKMTGDAHFSASGTAGAKAAADDDAAAGARDFLEAAVLGAVAEGLEELCRTRPPNPVDHLALFLLRRSKSDASVEVAEKDAVPVEPPKRT